MHDQKNHREPLKNGSNDKVLTHDFGWHRLAYDAARRHSSNRGAGVVVVPDHQQPKPDSWVWNVPQFK